MAEIIVGVPEAPSTIDFIKVSGAGTTEVNGVYKQNGEQNGKYVYQNDTHEIIWNNTEWDIKSKQNTSIIYTTTEDVATPDLVQAWSNYTGATPTPEVIKVSYNEFLTVTNAGSSIVNKPFVLSEIKNGKPSYTRNDTHPVEDGIVIEWNIDQWEINGVPTYEGGTYLEYYAAVESVDTPDLVTGWETAKNGSIPYPVFVVGLVKPFVSAVSRAVKRNRG